MEIKKADSKGRISGFEPGSQYRVARTETNEMIIKPVAAENRGGIARHLPDPPEGMKWTTDVFMRQDLTSEALRVQVTLEADYGSGNLPAIPVYGYQYSIDCPPEIDEVVKTAEHIKENYVKRQREIIEERKKEANLKEENAFFVTA